ncbi:hypothetical protein CTEN210_10317 [Chaetoceros tenuissimus]|uniref:EGF-like domain-containing protein n=1 Tax=Chaetoceros tenuissimus TaxID=426638 RepID=A0AAD3CZ44_9STRA|nr:hypothetical protein CTEN210_10317 [Chaetoceros tenuissimus]
MKFHLLTSYPLFLLGTIFVSHMCQMSDALYIDGMVRLFRGEGNYNDLINGYDLNDLVGSGHSFATQTLPTAGAQARQVGFFDGRGKAIGAATGLPTGAAPRSMMGWFKWDSPWAANGPFGYGKGGGCNFAYSAYMHSHHIPLPILELDQTCHDEGINPVLTSVPANTWYHIAFTYDGTYHRKYVNGVFQGEGIPDTQPDTQLERVTMGGNPTAHAGSYFRGFVADFAIFDRAITDAEVASIYNTPEGLTSGSLGESCTSDSNCGSGFVCDIATTTCKVDNGGTCSAASDCSSGFCAGSPLTCTDGAIGSPCGSGSDCSSTFCDSGTSTCKVANGGSCSAASDCSSGFCAGSPLTCTDGAIGSPCGSGSDCSSTFWSPLTCTDGAIGSPCGSGSDCSSTFCDSGTSTCKVANGGSCSAASDCSSGYCAGSPLTCTDGAIGSTCGSGSDCSSTFCDSETSTCKVANGGSCSAASDCSSGYCSPTSNTCATRPILDPCHGITCSNHGKCKGNGLCHCEDTFIQTNDGKDCACPNGSFLNESVNRCYAPTSSPTPSPTSSPVTASPTSSPTSVVTNAPTPEVSFDTPCEDGSGTFTVNNKEVGCDWLSKNKKREQKRKDVYCALNEVKLMCPSTCDVCACVDSFSYTFELKNGVNEVGCDWISKNSNKAEKRRSKYCTDDYDDGAVMNACRKSCNLC